MDYTQLFQRYDHPTRWEYPPGVKHGAVAERFAAFLSALSAALGTSLTAETGAYIQDASFHSQIHLPLLSGRQALIRFSNFGDMATISDDEPVPESTVEVVTDLLVRNGYTYIPPEVLHARYTGSNPGVTGIASWWTRYFDWV